MRSRRHGWEGLALAGCTLLAACATSPIRLDPQRLASGSTAPARPRAPQAGTPLVWFAPVVDGRADQGSLGFVGGREVTSTAVTGWLDQQLAALDSADFAAVQGVEPAPEARLLARPRILKAYLDNQGMTKTANVVLSVEIGSPGAAPRTRVFRGSHASMNMWGSEAEFIDALRDAAWMSMELLRMSLEADLVPGRPPHPLREAPSRAANPE